MHCSTHAYSAELWGLRHFSRIQLQRLGTRWHMMKWSNSESDSRNIREADIASSKDTPEPARKTLVAWPWEKPRREITWVVAQKKLEGMKRENTDYCFVSRCAQSKGTLCKFFLNKQKHIKKLNSLPHPSVLQTETTCRDPDYWSTTWVKEGNKTCINKGNFLLRTDFVFSCL